MEVQVVVPPSSSCSSSSSALPVALDTIEVEWKGTKYPISIFEGDTVKELRQRIFDATLVPPPDQKILGPGIKAKLDDTILIKDLKLAKGKSLKMVGTPVSERPPPSPVNSSSSFMGRGYEVTEDQDIHLQEVNKSKIENAIQRVQVKEIFSPPRDGFKLLVLDIDYTLFDHHSFADRAQELVRPYLHEFLTRMYRHYDLMIWSATNYEMIERKMQAFGVTNHPDYKIVCYFASNAMITVYSQKYKITRVKPLKVIWAKFPDRYNESNTIMIDDLRRNFLMNPLNGIKIRSYRSAHLNREMDDELLKVGEYLEDISTLDDLTTIDHRRWRRRLRQKRRM